MSYYAEHYHNLKKLVRPKGTTHAKILCDDKKKGFTPIKDFDVFQGVSGTVTFLKEKRDKTYVELGKMYFDGVWAIREKQEK